MAYPRITKLRKTFKDAGISAYLVTHPINIRYLTNNIPSSDSWLLVTKKKIHYITDRRYEHEVNQLLKGVHVVCWEGSMAQTTMQCAKSDRVRALGIDENHLSVAQFKTFKKEVPKSIKIVRADGFVEALREMKDDDEIKLIKRALKMHHKALKFISPFIKPNATEEQILHQLRCFIVEQNISFAFDPICASGPNAAMPHAAVSRRKIFSQDVFLLDMGMEVEGYKSDLTRMFFFGKIPDLTLRVTEAVYEAQQKAIQKIKPGAMAGDIDAQARNYLKEKDLSHYFSHGLGHGVGLDIHESPRLGPNSKQELKEGMVVTVEPAIYIPNKFGVRLEEMVLVTKDGYEVLSAACH